MSSKKKFTRAEIEHIIRTETPQPGVSMAKTPLPTSTTFDGTTVDGIDVIKTACSHNCYDTCGVRCYVKEGKLFKVDGDPDHPISRGTLCVKGYAYPQRINSPDRIKYPLLRTGERGEGKFRRITWEEAWDHIIDGISAVRDTYGSEAFMEYCYSGNREFLAKQISGRFLNLFGASKLVGSFCLLSGLSGTTATFGRNASMQTVEIWTKHTDCMILWGGNYSAAGIHHLRYILEATERGVPMVVIDSYVTAIASKADVHLQPFPGTDGALALGMINYIVKEDLHDKEFIADKTYGFEQLMEVAKEWTLERTSQVTSVPAEKIAYVAEMYAKSHSMIECGYGHQRYTNGHQVQRAIQCLAAVAGHVGKPGATCNFMEVGAAYTGFLNSAKVQAPAGAEIKKTRLISISHFGPALRAATDPPIKAVISWRGAMITQQADASGIIEAIKNLDLYVCIEQFMTDDVQWADIVLPACTMFEQYGIHPSYRHQYLQIQVPAIQPLYECMSDIDIWSELGRRMGYEEYFPEGKSGMDWIKELVPEDFDVAQAVSPNGPVRLAARFCPPVPNMLGEATTPSGKIELYSLTYEDRATKFPGEWNPLPIFYYPIESVKSDPARGLRYPLQLTSQHPPLRTHTQFYELPNIYEIDGPPWIGLNPVEAEARGIKEGDRVRVFNDRGEAHALARLIHGNKVGTLELDSGYYVKSGANANLLIDKRTAGPRDVGDGIMEEYDFQLDGHTIPYNDCLVDVEKAEEA